MNALKPSALICCDKGSIAAPNKKCHQWDVRLVLPIGGIFMSRPHLQPF